MKCVRTVQRRSGWLSISISAVCPQHKLEHEYKTSMTLLLQKLALELQWKHGQTEKEAEHWAPHQTMLPGFHCQDNLEKEACAQLLPQPQEGLTSLGLIHPPASEPALCVTASFRSDGGGGDDGDCWETLGWLRWSDQIRSQSLRFLFSSVSCFFYNSSSSAFVLTLCLLSILRLPSPSFCPFSLPEWREGGWGQSR